MDAGKLYTSCFFASTGTKSSAKQVKPLACKSAKEVLFPLPESPNEHHDDSKNQYSLYLHTEI